MFGFYSVYRKKRKRTYECFIAMNTHRVHVSVWCMGLALTHTMHSRPGLPDLLALLPPSTVAAV